MTPQEKQHSAGLMRVNHCGEICAQALYLGQSITARSPMLKEAFNQAAAEECDHLSWCADRLRELDSHKSYLNPFWFSGSLLIGAFAGIVGDKWSLGFLAQTEQQVYRHLGDHLEKLPVSDLKSRAIVEQMQREEAQHAQTAISHGAKELPLPIQTTMRWVSGVMTTVAYYL
jgi:ubiquinone biosynthesis monooxygenase Coq7